jgi:hypothetical protein
MILLEGEIYGQIKYYELELLNSSTEHLEYFKQVKFPQLVISLVVEPKDSNTINTNQHLLLYIILSKFYPPPIWQ